LDVFSPEGIDLQRRSNEVAKILFAKFGRRIQASGWSPDEILQEVYRGILARNVGKCPWDREKSTFGHYVYMVCQCILANYRKQEARKIGKEVEMVGDIGVDAHDVTRFEAMESLIGYLKGRGAGESLCKMVGMLQEGRNQKEIMQKLGLSRTRVSDGVRRIQKAAREWADLNGIR